MSSTNTELVSQDAEQGLIGSVLIDPGLFLTLDILPQHFFIHRLRYIWEAFTRLYEKEIEIDFTTVHEELDRMNKAETVGSPGYLASMINNTPTSLHAEDYARIVKDYAQRRAWRELAGDIARIAFDMDSQLDLEAGNILGQLTGSIETRGSAVHISRYTQELREEVIARCADPKDVWGIPTGFIDFDDITGGLQSGEILYISGEPGMGKSMWAMQAGFQMAGNGRPGAIYSLEMPGRQTVRRRVSHQAKIPVRAMKTGRMTDEFWIEFGDAIEKIDKLPLYMSDSVQWTTASLRADLARLKAQYGIEWFVLDYAYLLQDGRHLSENDRTGFISAQLKAICRSLNLAGIVIHSLNKGGMGEGKGMPGGENLRGSGQQFYDPDLLLFLVKGESPTTVLCMFGKGRELENPKQAFELLRMPGFPALGNAVTRKMKTQP